MLHYSRHAVRQAWTSYVGAFVALSLGVVLIGLAVVALQSVDATLLGLGPDQDDAREALDGLTSMLGVMAGMAVFMSLFVVGSTFSFVVASRQRELGLLRLVGATSRQVRLLVAGEAVVVAVVAALAGCALTLLAGVPALGLLTTHGLTPVPLEMQRSWLPVLVAAPPAIVVALLGSWRSARRAGRATPVDALREAAVERRLVTVTGALVGLIALGAAVAGTLVAARGGPLGALVLSVLLPEVLVVAMMCFGGVLFPAVARLVSLPFVHRGDATLLLARDNLLAAPRRTASLAAPVVAIAAIGGSLIVALSLAADWSTAITRTRLVAPAVVENAGPRAAEALAASPAVGLADSGLATTVRINDEDGVIVEGIDVRAAGRTRSLEAVRGSLDSFSGNVVAVSDVMAWDLGWQVGERLQVRWPDGSRGPVRVVALVPEAPDLYPEVIAPRSLVRERAPQARASTYFVLPAPGHSVTDVKTALAGTGAEVHEAGAWADV
ncbi:FtsX-like permease family protein, partial [Nocardioides sp.]|uniref:FtsX-like permease family protein n=1 Tax=Nocardioides sp. TaxID=35761 RepID=UPI002732B017